MSEQRPYEQLKTPIKQLIATWIKSEKAFTAKLGGGEEAMRAKAVNLYREVMKWDGEAAIKQLLPTAIDDLAASGGLSGEAYKEKVAHLSAKFDEVVAAAADYKKYPIVASAKALKSLLPFVAVTAGLYAASAIDNEANASMGKSSNARKAGNNKLADEHRQDVLIHNLRGMLQGIKVATNALPIIGFIAAATTDLAVDKADTALKSLTIEGKAVSAENQKLADAFRFLIRPPNLARRYHQNTVTTLNLSPIDQIFSMQ